MSIHCLPPLPPAWHELLKQEFSLPYWLQLQQFLATEWATHPVYPESSEIFRAFEVCSPAQTRVVILGQDPYHGPGQAHGLSFSVKPGVKLPPSLKNIYRELAADLGGEPPPTGDLSHWATQGVLLLNSVLTVRAAHPASHAGQGWELLTDAVIQHLAAQDVPKVFLLWGRYAQAKGAWLDRSRHCVLEAAHPSPFAAHKGFFGCRHFSKTNQWLVQHRQQPIDWSLLPVVTPG